MENQNKDPVQMLGELAKNPEMLRSMMSALAAASTQPTASSPQTNTAPAVSTPPASSSPQTNTAPMPDLSAMLSDPQTLAKISGVMSMLKSSGVNSPSVPAVSAPAAHSPDKSAALLLALKPYLSADRQTAIESLIKFSKFGEILKNM